MQKILIVEDEKKLARYLELELNHEGYQIKVANDGREALNQHEQWQPDLIVLDLMLPQLSGIEVCRRIRQSDGLPIIMLTAKDDISDKVMGLDMGADDYMTKPFAIEELLARIRVALKRKNSSDTSKETSPWIEAGPLKLNSNSRSVQFGEELIRLTKKEFDLLEYLLQRQNIALSREDLLSNVWGYEFMGDTNVVDVYIRYLRLKIDDLYNVKLIHTIRGVGYLLRYEEG